MDVTFELTIRFCSEKNENRIRHKETAMLWLSRIGRDDYIEGVLDGVEAPFYSDVSSNDVGGLLEISPILIYDKDLTKLEDIASKLKKKFLEDVTVKILSLPDDAWQEAWVAELGVWKSDRFVVIPKGYESSVSAADHIPLFIDSEGGAFGTAQHKTTRGLLRCIEKNIPLWKPKSVLDIGTGTGILAIACAKLGVRSCVGTEIDQSLVDLSKKNAAFNRVLLESYLMERPVFGQKFDLILANILVPVLHSILPEVVVCLEAGGRVILAGFIEKEQEELLKKAESLGLTVEQVESEQGWQIVTLIKN